MTVRFVFRCIVGAVLLLSAQVASAQQGPATQTPAQVLGQFPNGGPAMVTAVQDLMNANQDNLAAIIAFAKTADEDQRRAIGTALANVARGYAANGQPGAANHLTETVVNAGLPELAKAYADAGGDTGTAAGGGGGGGQGPTAVGPPTGGPNTGTIVGTNTFVGTVATGLFNGNNGGGGGFSQPVSSH